MPHLKQVALVTMCLLGVGCNSLGEKIRAVNFEGKAEKEHLEPHEQRRRDLEYLAEPR